MRDPVSCVAAVAGAPAGAPPPGLQRPPEGCDLRFIPGRESLAREAADADVAFVWQPRLDWLATEWGGARGSAGWRRRPLALTHCSFPLLWAGAAI